MDNQVDSPAHDSACVDGRGVEADGESGIRVAHDCWRRGAGGRAPAVLQRRVAETALTVVRVGQVVCVAQSHVYVCQSLAWIRGQEEAD